MRNFDWGQRVAHLLGEIIEALIILVCVAVLAGLIFLLVRYLLVATRAAQLYVAQHEPPRATPPAATGGQNVGPGPAAPTQSETSAASSGSDSAATTVQMPEAPGATAVTKPSTRGRAPKTPPSS